MGPGFVDNKNMETREPKIEKSIELSDEEWELVLDSLRRSVDYELGEESEKRQELLEKVEKKLGK